MTITVFHGRSAQGDVKVFPLSLAQEGLWIHNQVKSGQTFNTLSTIVHVKRALNTKLLTDSLNVLIQRHDALRTTFQVIEGQPLQIISPMLSIPLPVTDLRCLSEAQKEAEAQRMTKEEMLRPFDLTQGPLVRASLLQLAAEEYMLLLNIHELVCDRWSMDVCLHELITLYEAFASGQPSP